MPTDLEASAIFDQIILQPLHSPSGVWEVRFNRGVPTYEVIGGYTDYTGAHYDRHYGSLTLTGPSCLVDIGEITRRRVDESCELVADDIVIKLYDPIKYTGLYTNDSVTAEEAESDLSRYETSLFDEFFKLNSTPDPDVDKVFNSFYIFLTRISGEEREICYSGMMDPRTFSRQHTLVLNQDSSTEFRQQIVEVHCTTALMLKKKKVADFKAAVTLDDMQTNSSGHPLALFNRIIPEPQADRNDLFQAAAEFLHTGAPDLGFVASADYDAWLTTDAAINIGAPEDIFDIAIQNRNEWGTHHDLPRSGNVYDDRTSLDDAYVDTFPKGAVWSMTIARVLEVCARICAMEISTPSGDVESAFEIFLNGWNNTRRCYDNVPVTDLVGADFQFDFLTIAYNWLFGVSPLDGSTIQTPISFADDATIAEVISKFARMFGCYLDTSEINQTTGIVRLRLVPLHKEMGDFPESLILTNESSQQPAIVAKDAIQVTNAGSNDTLIGPRKQGDISQMEILLKSAPFGNSSVHCFWQKHFFFDKTAPWEQQWEYAHIFDSVLGTSVGYVLDANLTPFTIPGSSIAENVGGVYVTGGHGTIVPGDWVSFGTNPTAYQVTRRMTRVGSDYNFQILGGATATAGEAVHVMGAGAGPANGGSVGSNGWAMGQYLYYKFVGDENWAYPKSTDGTRDAFDLTKDWSVDGSEVTSWEGLYAIRGITERPGVYTNRENTLYAPLQYYSRELLLNRTVISRSYAGLLGDGGTLNEVKLGMIRSWKVGGTVRKFRVSELRQDIGRDLTSVQWVEVPDDSTIEDIPTYTLGDGTTGMGGITTAGTGFTNSGGGGSGGTSANRGTAYHLALNIGEGRTADSDFTKDANGYYSTGLATGSHPEGILHIDQGTEDVPAYFASGHHATVPAAEFTSDGGAPALRAHSLQIPTVDAAAGKFLRSLDSDGNAEWQAADTPSFTVARLVVAGGNVAIDGSVTTLQSLTLAAGDVILLTAQTTASQNGLWVVGAPAAAWSRYSMDPVSLEAVLAREGDNAGSLWRLVTTGTITLGTTSLSFTLAKADVFDGSITNTKLATDVKVGSLAALTTTIKSSVVAAINEIKAALVSTFLGLSDTPSTYSGSALKALRVNTGGTALEFYTPSTGATAFTGLSDAPSSYTSQAGKYVQVNGGATGLQFTTLTPVVPDSSGSQTAAHHLMWTGTGYGVTDSIVKESGTRAGISTTTLAVAYWDVNINDNTDAAIRARNAGSGLALSVTSVSGKGISVSSAGDGVTINATGSGKGIVLVSPGDGLNMTVTGGIGMNLSYSGSSQAQLVTRNISAATTPVSEILQTSSTNAQATQYLENDGTGECLKLVHTGSATPSTTSNNLITGWNSTTRTFRVTRLGALFANGGLTASGADLAELRSLETSATATPGDVLVLSTTEEGSVKQCSTANDLKVCGVYSTAPAFTGDEGGALGGDPTAIPLAICGIVPCNVVLDAGGDIAVGDVLVAGSLPGHAVKNNSATVGTVLGKAMQAFSGPLGATSTINVLVSLS